MKCAIRICVSFTVLTKTNHVEPACYFLGNTMRKQLFATTLLLCCSHAYAQEAVTIPDIMQGHWVTLHHSLDGGAHTDACIVKTSGGALEFRADTHGSEIRTEAEDMSVSDGQKVPVTLVSGSSSTDFAMVALDHSTLRAPLTPSALNAVLNTFGNAQTLTLRITGASDRNISLTGSGIVLNGFRKCMTDNGFTVAKN